MKRAELFTISSPAKLERLQAGLDAARDAGFELGEVPDCIHSAGYLAGDDDARAQSLRRALASKEADFAWAIRGGYGAARTPLPGAELLRDGNTVLGFSDLTYLLAIVHAAGGQAIHGPVLTSYADADEPSRQALNAALAGEPRRWQLQTTDGKAQLGAAPVIGGNLAVLATLLGTQHCPQFAGHYVVLEDVGEAHYRLDRALNHLLRASDLSQAKGIILGHFVHCPEGAAPLMERLVRAHQIPCWTHAPVGHGHENHAFIWGEQASIDGVGQMVLHGS